MENSLVKGGLDGLISIELEESAVDRISVAVEIFSVVVIAEDRVGGIGDPV